jgi:hypothetical protein
MGVQRAAKSVLTLRCLGWTTLGGSSSSSSRHRTKQSDSQQQQQQHQITIKCWHEVVGVLDHAAFALLSCLVTNDC